MKLNYKRTVLVGFAFFLICAFWSAYDAIVPLILTNRFDMDQGWSGVIMALDNIFAVFMLPIFGAISDKTNSRFGKRTPFIVVGTVCAAIFFVFLGFAPSLALFIGLLLLCLISMAVFRSPAVALMPDVTLKPLRSKGNAIINLMGTVGGALTLVAGKIFHTGDAGKTDFGAYLISVSVLMLVSLAVFLLTVREPLWVAETQEQSKALGLDETPEEKTAGGALDPAKRRSLLFLLASVALWYIAYNAITSKYSVYASTVLHVEYTMTLLVAQGVALVAFLPVGMIATKIGRKKTILAGVILLTVAFALGSFIKEGTPAILMYLLFSVAGVGWATINVNSFPMVVELASESDVGKYTGYYYTASMAAQIVTPIFSGFLVDWLGWGIFFPYAAIFAALAFVTMLFVRHGDSKPVAEGDALERLGAMDAD